MPIEYSIDHNRRLVTAQGRGTITDDDIYGYQEKVWSRPDVAGYNELVDMSAVTQIVRPSVERIQDLARFSAAMDVRSPKSKFAIVAPNDLAFGLGRMYGAHRDMDPRSTKRVAVFRSLAEALAFLNDGGEADARPSESA